MPGMTTTKDDVRAALERISVLTPTQANVYRSTVNDEFCEAVFRELLDITHIPPPHRRCRPGSTPKLKELAERWLVGYSSDPLTWLLRQSTHSVQNDVHRTQLRIIMQTDKERGSVDSDISQREADAAAAIGRARGSGLANDRKRNLVPALAGGVVTALDRGPRVEYRNPDGPNPEEVNEIFALFAQDRKAEAEALLQREVDAELTVPRWRQWVGPVWAWWWHHAGQPAEKFRFLRDDAAASRAPWMTTEFEANRIAITSVPPIISDYNDFNLGALPIAHHYVKEIERSTGKYWKQWKPRNSPFLLDINRHVWPGFLAIHAVVQTRDGWLIMSHRERRAAGKLRFPPYFPDCWSLSFEEQADPRSHDDWAGDQSVADVAIRGLREELGLVCSDIQVQCHLIGRECVPIPIIQDGFVLNAAAFCTICLDENAEAVWPRLSLASDRAEHRDFLACKLETKEHLRQALRATTIEELVTDSRRIQFSAPDASPSGPLRWHPTSRARLALWGLGHLRR